MTAELDFSGEAVTTEVNDVVELGVRVNRDEKDDTALTENEAINVAVTEKATLDVLEGTLDNEMTDETVGSCSAVIVLEIEAYDVIIAEIEALLDLIAFKDITGLRESSDDADEDGVILRVAIDERDNNGDDVDDNEATDETLPRAEKDVIAVSVP